MFVLLLLATAVASTLAAASTLVAESTLLAEWRALDYAWDSNHTRAGYISEDNFVVENNIITGIKVWDDVVYVTVPRWRHGVPSTLNTIQLANDGNATGSALTPFPSWEMNEEDDCDAFQYVQSMEVDPGGVMWVIDCGRINFFDANATKLKTNCPPKIVRIDLSTGMVLSRYELPDSSANHTTNFINDIVIDVENQFAFISNLDGSGNIVVYDHGNQRSRNFADPATMAPQAVNWTIGQYYYGNTISSPVDGIALSPDASRLYYSPLTGTNMTIVNASLLRDFDRTEDEIRASLVSGITKMDSSDGMTMDCQGHLYYGGLVTSSVYSYDIASSRPPVQASERLVDNAPWPDTFAISGTDLYLTSNALNKYFNGQMDFVNDINMRVFKLNIGAESYMAGSCDEPNTSTTTATVTPTTTTTTTTPSDDEPSEGVICHPSSLAGIHVLALMEILLL